jgi:hypothetical protein
MNRLQWIAIVILVSSGVFALRAQAQSDCDAAAIEAGAEGCEESDAVADETTSDEILNNESEAQQATQESEPVEATPENVNGVIRNAEATDTATAPVADTPAVPTEPSLEERIRQGQARTQAEHDKDTADLRRREAADPCFPDSNGGNLNTTRQIKFIHNGAYIAEFFAEWESPCARSSGRWQSGQKTSGYTYTLSIPMSVTRIKVRATNQTGLVWQPNNTIFDLNDMPAILNKCFKVGGTTLNSNVTNCEF